MTRIYNEVGPKRTFKYWIEFLTFRMVFMKSPPAFQWACVRKLSFLDTHFRFRDVEVDSDHELVPPATHWQIVLSNVTGTIPKEIGKLDGLLVVKLGNSLSGPIPDEFGNLIHLRMLDLGSNRLSGPLPGVFASLRSLKMLVLSNNRLTGSIPSWIGNLTALVDLWLDGNQFSGEIPGSVGKLTSLEFFNVRDNNLSGEIPPEMQQLKALDVLWAYGNAGLTCSFHFPQLRVGVNE
ncbi:hypothetical protein BDR26DRAFT_867866 [Obelidium mucronatum]|nr:hypothetical protein BDR26DRAFT_867866 [Obelidium mucronatum]